MTADHPYKELPSYAYWRRSFADVPFPDVDVVAKFPFLIEPQHKIATAGSCFAQHIARRLSEGGFNYLVAEPGHPLLGDDLRKQFNYGVFSARYGNIYTSRQLLQLIQRAYGEFQPVDDVWQEGERFVDPWRPTVQPRGFASLEEFRRDRSQHLAAVRRMFEELDIFVFTMGLTECFVNQEDGAAYPVCPGVSGGVFDAHKHVFLNESVTDVVGNFEQFLARLRSVRPLSRIILTVSPVPLIATAVDRHVLQSTTYSKAVLRVAAEEIVSRHEGVAYFPSYEVITGNFNRGAYFGPDLREVEEAGVEHVMRLFFKYATDAAAQAVPRRGRTKAPDISLTMKRATAVVCDEELLDVAV